MRTDPTHPPTLAVRVAVAELQPQAQNSGDGAVHEGVQEAHGGLGENVEEEEEGEGVPRAGHLRGAVDCVVVVLLWDVRWRGREGKGGEGCEGCDGRQDGRSTCAHVKQRDPYPTVRPIDSLSHSLIHPHTLLTHGKGPGGQEAQQVEHELPPHSQAGGRLEDGGGRAGLGGHHHAAIDLCMYMRLRV